jgi:hypothetical protein
MQQILPSLLYKSENQLPPEFVAIEQKNPLESGAPLAIYFTALPDAGSKMTPGTVHMADEMASTCSVIGCVIHSAKDINDYLSQLPNEYLQRIQWIVIDAHGSEDSMLLGGLHTVKNITHAQELVGDGIRRLPQKTQMIWNCCYTAKKLSQQVTDITGLTVYAPNIALQDPEMHWDSKNQEVRAFDQLGKQYMVKSQKGQRPQILDSKNRHDAAYQARFAQHLIQWRDSTSFSDGLVSRILNEIQLVGTSSSMKEFKQHALSRLRELRAAQNHARSSNDLARLDSLLMEENDLKYAFSNRCQTNRNSMEELEFEKIRSREDVYELYQEMGEGQESGPCQILEQTIMMYTELAEQFPKLQNQIYQALQRIAKSTKIPLALRQRAAFYASRLAPPPTLTQRICSNFAGLFH